MFLTHYAPQTDGIRRFVALTNPAVSTGTR